MCGYEVYVYVTEFLLGVSIHFALEVNYIMKNLKKNFYERKLSNFSGKLIHE
jgi:hypothetical protein